MRLSARAVFSKYNIQPASPIDFGAMIQGTKKTQVFVLENKGILNFKFHIHQAPVLQKKRPRRGILLAGGAQGTAVRHQPLLEFFLQAHLTLGMFTVSPCSGSIAPWGQQQITVECHAEPLGKCEEQLYIDVHGR
ncbi:HYDIN protein, partial [Calyptomena viridis]|nr:HYDIN protein [Calyptomena viridis]